MAVSSLVEILSYNDTLTFETFTFRIISITGWIIHHLQNYKDFLSLKNNTSPLKAKPYFLVKGDDLSIFRVINSIIQGKGISFYLNLLN